MSVYGERGLMYVGWTGVFWYGGRDGFFVL